MAKTAQGEAEYCIAMRPHPSAVFYHIARLYGAFTDLLVLHETDERIISVILCDSS